MFLLDQYSTGKGWNTTSTMSKARKFGYTRYDDTYDTWVETFRAFENAGILPHRDALLKGDPVLTKLPSKAAATNGIHWRWDQRRFEDIVWKEEETLEAQQGVLFAEVSHLYLQMSRDFVRTYHRVSSWRCASWVFRSSSVDLGTCVSALFGVGGSCT